MGEIYFRKEFFQILHILPVGYSSLTLEKSRSPQKKGSCTYRDGAGGALGLPAYPFDDGGLFHDLRNDPSRNKQNIKRRMIGEGAVRKNSHISSSCHGMRFFRYEERPEEEILPGMLPLMHPGGGEKDLEGAGEIQIFHLGKKIDAYGNTHDGAPFIFFKN
jgi:hypothetical protein